ncbi:MAG: SulP family inorganic anion transporter [Nitrospirota bacterium]|nr:SulP family inorganic anion transporter [Nitrospirota bacterium]
MGLVHGLHFNNLRGDIYGGMVAAVVALPLALAFGVASGLGAIAGLYGAIFVGFFAALFGGTPAQVSGPTGPMTVVMAGIVTIFMGNPGLALMAVILGGGFQILLGLSRVGQYIALVPYPVVSGFMSGIGCIILILQLGPLVGHAASPEGVVATLKAIPGFYGEPVWDAALASGLVLAIMYLTPGRIAKLVPSSLLALLVVTPLAYAFLPDAPIIGEVPRGFPTPLMPTLSWDTLKIVLESAVVLAVLGAIDSLLTSLVCDNMTRTQHDSDRELIGQGIGNMVAGVFGGIPGAGATMRSVANIRTGGRTPISGALHSIILLAVLLGLGPLAEKIPLAVLGGILFKVGIDIIDWRFLRHVLQAPRIDVVIMTVVLLTTVLVDLITAVAVGMILASLFFVKRMADLELANLHIVTNPTPSTPLLPEEATILEQANGKILLIHVDGPMSFGSAKNMVRRLESVKGFNTFTSVVLDLSKVPAIDGTAALAVEDMLNIVQAHHQHLFFVGMQPHVTKALDGLGVLVQIRPGHRFASRLEALQKASMAEQASSKDPSGASTPNRNLPATP